MVFGGWAFMVFCGAVVSGFLGGGLWFSWVGELVLVCWREVGFSTLPLWGGWLECGRGRGEVGGWAASLSVGVSGAFLLRGARWDVFACWREVVGADYWKQKEMRL